MAQLKEIVCVYQRKINHEAYGGLPYEGSTHFASLKVETEESDDPREVYQTLLDSTREMVEDSIEAELASWSGGVQSAVFKKLLDKYRVEGSITVGIVS